MNGCLEIKDILLFKEYTLFVISISVQKIEIMFI